MTTPTRSSTAVPDGSIARSRVVDRIVIHRDPVEFRALCEQAIRPNTKYLVLDLDRTFHFGRNLGELLGWELSAYIVYGEKYLDRIASTRGSGRFLLDWSRPWTVARYFARGARLWAYPGLFYLFAVKIGTRIPWVRRHLYDWLGVDPIEAVQQVPRYALMHQLSEVPTDKLRELSRAVWRHCQDEQVISAADLTWLRQRCPGIKIIVSSASPQPVLEAAAAELDVDDVFYTTVEEHDGYLSAPPSLHKLFLLPRAPRRISPPSHVRVNAGDAKAKRLLDRYPDFGDPDVETVGITDTSYGEDHAWANYFKTVIDINSPAPFAPIVAAHSPLREIHSAKVLTRAELRGDGRATHDKTRARVPEARARQETLATADLLQRLGAVLPRVESLLAKYELAVASASDRRRALQNKLDALIVTIEAEVGIFNDAAGSERGRALRRLYHHSKASRMIKKQIAKTERELAAITYTLTRLLESSRSMLDPTPDPG